MQGRNNAMKSLAMMVCLLASTPCLASASGAEEDTRSASIFLGIGPSEIVQLGGLMQVSPEIGVGF